MLDTHPMGWVRLDAGVGAGTYGFGGGSVELSQQLRSRHLDKATEADAWQGSRPYESVYRHTAYPQHYGGFVRAEVGLSCQCGGVLLNACECAGHGVLPSLRCAAAPCCERVLNRG